MFLKDTCEHIIDNAIKGRTDFYKYLNTKLESLTNQVRTVIYYALARKHNSEVLYFVQANKLFNF